MRDASLPVGARPNAPPAIVCIPSEKPGHHTASRDASVWNGPLAEGGLPCTDDPVPGTADAATGPVGISGTVEEDWVSATLDAANAPTPAARAAA